MNSLSSLMLGAFVLLLFSCSSEYSDLDNGLYAEFKTTKGDFIAELYQQDVPMTVANFVALAEGIHPLTEKRYSGKPLYDSLIFHRVVKDFVIQAGDPRGTGRGGPGFKFPDETREDLTFDKKGILSMANSDLEETKIPYENLGKTNGSQFFITLKPAPRLNGLYSIFGKVIHGLEVVDSIGAVKTNRADRPLDKIFINKVNIIRKGEEAQNFDAIKAFEAGLVRHETKLKDEAKAREKLINKISQGFEVAESGLRYRLDKEVEGGKHPKKNDILKVHYEGYLTDGTKFDSSYDRQQPLQLELGVGEVIPGWDEGLKLLKPGEKARFIIPPELSYEDRSVGPIPPNSILIFDVELIEIIED
ncbi:peptidylprolyl isomerase [Psychroflexus tropicus]|uniref:peptidylprolyl isomerase n=1 Tax=Psychroflexus tropicus TaxID=197345 RepID=UPI0003A9BB7D|nr:peptidylprolyl isomerase [Psychroflexus tropicus]